jgi:hypothetical protein
MARKRKKLKDLDYDSKEYWEALLFEDGLSMKRGTTSKLSYVGTTQDLGIMADVQKGTVKLITPKPQAE